MKNQQNEVKSSNAKSAPKKVLFLPALCFLRSQAFDCGEVDAAAGRKFPLPISFPMTSVV